MVQDIIHPLIPWNVYELLGIKYIRKSLNELERDISMARNRGEAKERPTVVIIGGGFAGMSAAKALGKFPVNVIVIDRTNHYLFQPLLYQVALAALPPSGITAPIRWMLRHQPNTSVVLGEVTNIDVTHKVVQIDDGTAIDYDYLLVATGSRHSYFGHDEWETVAPGLKTVEDALEIRRRFLSAFEKAENTTDPVLRKSLLTFVIIGGGPTGVELAGMISAIARKSLPKDYRFINTADARIVLIEGGPKILAAFPDDLSNRALKDLDEYGIEVRTNSVVTSVDDDAVSIGSERIPTQTIFWAAGNKASSLGAMLDAPLDRNGRVLVNPDLSVPNHPEIFVAGDLAGITQNGKPVPAVAPAANQEGYLAADNIWRSINNRPRRDFKYFNKGNLATIGRLKAIAELGKIHVSGAIAWWLWLIIHIMYLAGFRSRAVVLVEWAYSFFTNQHGSRLITKPASHEQKIRKPQLSH